MFKGRSMEITVLPPLSEVWRAYELKSTSAQMITEPLRTPTFGKQGKEHFERVNSCYTVMIMININFNAE